MSNMRYTVIIELAEDGSHSVYVPDLPGCVSTGDTQDEALANIREAIRGHVALLHELGEVVPEPRSHAEIVAA